VGLDQLPREAERLREEEIRIDFHRPLVHPAEPAVAHHQRDVRPPEDVALGARHGVVRSIAVDRCRHDREGGQRPGPLPSQQLAAAGDVGDAAGVERADPLAEQFLPLEEELPLLAERDLEPREVDRLLIGFHRREVGEDRPVEGHLRREAVACIQAGVPVAALVLLQAGQPVRNHLVAARRRGQLQAVEPSGLRDAVLVLQRSGPVADFERPPMAPSEVDAPGSALPGHVSQRRERDRELRRPAEAGAARRDLPRCVPASVHAAPVVGNPAVGLRAQGVGDEVVGGAAIVKRVEDDSHGVVAEQVGVALRELRGDLPLVPYAEGNVEMERVVLDERFGAPRRLGAAPRLVLHEPIDDRCRRPLAVAEIAVEDGRRPRLARRHDEARGRLIGGRGSRRILTDRGEYDERQRGRFHGVVYCAQRGNGTITLDTLDAVYTSSAMSSTNSLLALAG
jgi:hypothetical protein